MSKERLQRPHFPTREQYLRDDRGREVRGPSVLIAHCIRQLFFNPEAAASKQIETNLASKLKQGRQSLEVAKIQVNMHFDIKEGILFCPPNLIAEYLAGLALASANFVIPVIGTDALRHFRKFKDKEGLLVNTKVLGKDGQQIIKHLIEADAVTDYVLSSFRFEPDDFPMINGLKDGPNPPL